MSSEEHFCGVLPPPRRALQAYAGSPVGTAGLADRVPRLRQTLDTVGMLAENCQFYYAEVHDTYLNKYSDRYFSRHAKDYLPSKTSVPVGQGTLDWKKITLAKQARIVNYFAEAAAYDVGALHGVPASAWPGYSLDQLRQRCQFLRQSTI